MHPQLCPGHHFEEFFQCSQTTRQRDEAVGQFCHLCFAFMHGLNYMQLGQLCIGHPHINQLLGDDADNLSPALQAGIRHLPHQTNA